MTASAGSPPLSDRLRALLVQHASVATLTCTFRPGGKFGGVGIRSHLFCAHCSHGIVWHELAAGLALIVWAEQAQRAGVDLDAMRAQLATVLAEGDATARLIDECKQTIASRGESREETSTR